MKKLFLHILLAALLPLSIFAQDARNRTTTTIVADGLAQLPAATSDVYNQVMGELAQTGADGIVQLAGMLVPADKGQNATIEYALYGVTAYATSNPSLAAGVRRGLAKSLEKCTDNPNRAFLLTLLQMCATNEDVPVFVTYANDPYLSDWAIKGLATIPGSDEAILSLMNTDGNDRAQLAYAAGMQRIAAAEPILLSWISGADQATTTAIYKALAQCGTTTSLDVLAKAAKAENYAWVPSSATESYLTLLGRLSDGNTKIADSYAKKLLSATDRSHVRSAALGAIYKAYGKRATSYLENALKDSDRQYRVSALRMAEAFADEDIYALVGKKLSAKISDEAKADIINWLAANGASSQTDAILAFIPSTDAECTEAAIKAAGILGGDNALNALVGELGGDNAIYAQAALLRFNGSVNDAVIKALDSDDNVKVQALKIIGTRHMTEAADQVFACIDSNNEAVQSAAYDALIGVASPKDFNRIAALAEKSTSKRASLQLAMKRSIHALPADQQYAIVKPAMANTSNPSLYYPVLAQCGNSDAIAEILNGYNGQYRSEAFEALCTVNNPEMIDVLYKIATNDQAAAPAALTRYNQLVATSDYSDSRKHELYRQALELTDDSNVQNALLGSLANNMTYPSLLLAQKYISKPATATNAAYAVRNIASKNIDKFNDEPVRNALEEAMTHLRNLDDADAGYAVDDIKNMLSRMAANAEQHNELSAEEAAEGYELLFDGQSMDKWTGNTVDYVPMYGTINVSAKYGNGGNLYTVNEYSDFVLRFEFRFLQEGVNNGVGIRTPMGVDAAYHGMEIQILDHDAPIYKGLREYQVHGSVYGVIPAKRIVFPELGTWHTEEIRAVGDQITVTVNGEVIVDGNIREACQGHNVKAKGEERNLYTVDGNDHPGLFNKKGHIGFLGHGAGIQFRNIRVKDLTKK